MGDKKSYISQQQKN